MATWQEIGSDNFDAAQTLYEQRRYRSSVSRSYYAAFSTITHFLAEAGVRFGGLQETPSHQALPGLTKKHLALPEWQMSAAAAIIRRLYAARLAADYRQRATEASTAREALRDAAALFRHLGADKD